RTTAPGDPRLDARRARDAHRAQLHDGGLRRGDGARHPHRRAGGGRGTSPRHRLRVGILPRRVLHPQDHGAPRETPHYGRQGERPGRLRNVPGNGGHAIAGAMRRSLLLASVLAFVPVLAHAADVRVAGRRMLLQATGKRHGALIDLKDAAIAAPFPDPTLGAALIVSGGIGDGQCRVEIPLDPTGWTPIKGDGSKRGYRYRKPSPGTQGVRRITLRRGVLAIRAQGTGWPCQLKAASERLPVSVVLRVEGSR